MSRFVSPPPVYLHFLDRELGEAFEFRLDRHTAERALGILAIGTGSVLVCSVSALLENPGLQGCEGMVADLVAMEVLIPQSTHPTLAEFIDSRRTLYEHDQERYPRYFDVEPLGGLKAIVPRLVNGSTTHTLHERMLIWTGGDSPLPAPAADGRLPLEARQRMERIVVQELGRRDERAVTYAMFGGVVAGDPSGRLVERVVRRRISLEYTDHQRGKHGQLATGVDGALEALEIVLQREAPLERDVPVLGALLSAAGLGALISGWPRALWEEILPTRGSAEHAGLVGYIQWIARALDQLPYPAETRMLRRRGAVGLIKANAPRLGPARSGSAAGLLVDAQRNLQQLAQRLAKAGMKHQLEATADALVPLAVDVLLVVATEVEQRETLAAFGYEVGTSPPAHPRGFQIYLELGTFGGQAVVLVRSQMGAGGTGGSQFTVDDAIGDLQPSWVVMLGIAFGVDPESQSIGDVLVPTKVIPYDHKRIGTREGNREVQYRDDPVAPDDALIKRLRVAELDYTHAEIIFGPLLSGSDLLDNEEYRNELMAVAAAGKAVGGEMELAGVFAAAQRRGARWIAAKAICDFADGNKRHNKQERQRVAARNAAAFIRHVIDRGLLTSPPG